MVNLLFIATLNGSIGLIVLFYIVMSIGRNGMFLEEFSNQVEMPKSVFQPDRDVKSVAFNQTHMPKSVAFATIGLVN